MEKKRNLNTGNISTYQQLHYHKLEFREHKKNVFKDANVTDPKLNAPPPKADVNRIYAPKRERRRGIINLEICFQTTTIGGNKQLKRAESLN